MGSKYRKYNVGIINKSVLVSHLPLRVSDWGRLLRRKIHTVDILSTCCVSVPKRRGRLCVSDRKR